LTLACLLNDRTRVFSVVKNTVSSAQDDGAVHPGAQREAKAWSPIVPVLRVKERLADLRNARNRKLGSLGLHESRRTKPARRRNLVKTGVEVGIPAILVPRVAKELPAKAHI